MSAERRRHPRRDFEAPAQIVFGERLLEARVKDVCRDAVLIETETLFPLGTDLKVVLQLPQPHPPIRVAGRVQRLAPGAQGLHAMAVLFTEIAPSDLLRLDFIIELSDDAPADGERGPA